MLKTIDIFKTAKIEKMIICNDVFKKLDSEIKDDINKSFTVELMDDVRSATFFTLGETNIKNEPIVLMIDGRYLPSVYTGITEAWFQRRTIIIVALYEKYSEIKCEYLKRCTSDIITIYNEEDVDYKERINSAINKKYPAVINLKIDFSKKDEDVDLSVLDNISEILNKDNEMWLYDLKVKEEYNCKTKVISDTYKYGMLSKYMGYITGKNEKVLLVSKSEILKLDLNIFNNRYMNENFKVILFDNDNILKENDIEKWITENKINVVHKKTISKEELNDFWNSKEPEMVVIGGEQ